MSNNAARLNAINAVNGTLPVESVILDQPVTELFGCNVFSDSVMKARLPKATYKSVKKTIETASELDKSMADAVASAMRDWALEKGATHYAHVFFPLTGSTAEKHDSFIEPNGDGVVLEFTGKQLIQGEPDGSSFPNGGIRDTFEARGYTAWDITSPAYILETKFGTTLCIPTVFVSWTGEALDKKTPILRSNKAVDKQATRILKAFGHEEVSTVASCAGPEQEYFLIDSNFYYARPDLVTADRTVFGMASSKGQEFDDHYFGAVPERVLAVMMEIEKEMWKLGIPAKTRHNEVAPGQFELAPVYESGNVATDHQQLTVHIIKTVAKRHGLTALMHEKPFAGLNGSGKHLNWSIANSTQKNLLEPGSTPHENEQFLVFCAAVIKAVHQHQGLLRATIASASNDHRLGANEAPPAIISVYLGDQLADIFAQFAETGTATSSKQGGFMELGVDSLPKFDRDAGDRNRTSPFAFTGNRFEFRAVGSAQTIAGPLVALNTAMADAMCDIADQLEAALASGTSLSDAVTAVVAKVATENKNVIFNGNGYSVEEWHIPAVKERGLKKLDTTPEALPEIKSAESIALFGKHNVLSETELNSRYEVYIEQYIAKINVEANISTQLAKTKIAPAAVRYQTELAQNIAALKAAGVEGDTTALKTVTALITDLTTGIANLEAAHAGIEDHTGFHAKDVVIPAMTALRTTVDTLESVVADNLWPLPSYQEMLFIK